MTARWRGIRREFRVLAWMLWDAARPLNGLQKSAARRVAEVYVSDCDCYQTAQQSVEEKAA